MRALLAIVILAVLGWTGFWFWQAGARERAITGWLEERRAAGWVADAADVRVTGFPNRVDTVVKRLDLADPDEGWSWQAEELQILALAYKPHHVIAALPGEQVVATPYETVRATSDLLRGSVIFRPTPRLELDHSTFEIEGMELEGDSGWTATIGKAILATRQATGPEAQPFAHDVSFDAEGLRLPQAMAERAGAGSVLPAEITRVALDTTLVFDRAWDRPAIEGDNPVLLGVDVRDVTVNWGRLDLRGRGTLGVDAEGFAEGRLDLRARNWREMLDVAEGAGMIDPTVAGAARSGLALIARLAGNGDTLNVPLDFESGRTRLGPIPLGPAPRLAAR